MVSQAVARPARTAGQFLSGTVLVEFIDSFIYDMTDKQYLAAVGLLTVVIGYVTILVENKTGVALLRRPDGPDVNVIEHAEAPETAFEEDNHENVDEMVGEEVDDDLHPEPR